MATPTNEPKPGATPAADPNSTPTPSANAPATPTPPADPKPAPTPEELEAQAQEFSAAAFGLPAPKKPDPKPAADEPPKEPAPATPAAEEPKPAAEAPKKRDDRGRYLPKKKGQPTAEEVEAIARRVAAEEREAAQDPKPAEPPKPTPAPADDLANVSDEDRDFISVLAEMESNNPTHKGLADRHKKFLKLADQYRAQWEAKHPDESFDPDASEHSDFYRKNQPFVPRGEFKAAERSMIARQTEERVSKNVEEKLRKEFEPKLREIEAEKAQRAAQPKIIESVADAVEAVFKAAPEFEKLVEPGKLSEEAVAKMAELNPVIHHHVSEEAELVMSVVEELEKLNHLGDHYKFDTRKEQSLSNGRVILPHAMIDRAFRDLEAKMLAAPKEDRIDQGREWVTVAEQAKRVDDVRKSALSADAKDRKLREIEATTWVVSPEHIRNYLLNQSKARVAAISKKFGNFTKAPAATPTPNNQPAATSPEQPKPSAKADLPKGASTASVSDTVDNRPGGGGGGEKPEEEFARLAFS